ncbi:ATP-binding protein [Amycolatopsis carbonis]|uniref:ATP-binding protein n=1 Tax=Amycolatopsis carbonis TaxID=715471 RepID=A0A9Y2IN98_9PSEU|nr:SbcC/MukB-like Walker B domain-containing protein [Amycolatopsis sp. 2-15]WIX83480.1 ATP-binding protein [Amycolatopsis sp. 2-15]
MTQEQVRDLVALEPGDRPAPATVQHRLEKIQLVNWGGFEGHTVIDIDHDSTLMSGASGSGKSTVQDAWLALLQPSDTPFNGASNDAVGGRARSAEQRNLLSYLRGQTDTTEGEDGQHKAKVLRGDATDTWGAVGATFIGDHGRRVTAFRLYYAGARIVRSADVISRMFTFDGALDLTEFASLTGTRPAPFAPAQVKAAIPGVRHHETYQSFSQNLFTRLGIGANGDGLKALRLLARVQAGHQIRTVDELYKEMVLERPTTYDDADRAIGHFNALEDSYLKMRTEQEKAELLTPVVEWHRELRAAEAEIETIDTFGLTRSGDSPIGLWSLRTEDRLLTAASDLNREQRRRNKDELTLANRAMREADEALREARAEHDAAGGGTLRKLALDLETESDRRRERDEERADLANTAVALFGTLPGGLGTKDEYEQLRSAASEFLESAESATAELRDRRDALMRDEVRLLDRRRGLRDERASHEGRDGRIPSNLDQLREQVAEAAGFTRNELPFLAELIDVADEHRQWRTAIETVLGASARQLLVPAGQLQEFSRLIDPIPLKGRITFVGVPLREWEPSSPSRADPARVAGKLQFKDSLFTSWVYEHVSHDSRNALCVQSPADLAGHGYRVTAVGQTRQGQRGTHGRADRRDIIGFSNVEVLEAIDAELAEIATDLDALAGQIDPVEAEQSTLRARISACQAVGRVRWDAINVPGSDRRIAELEAQRDKILTSDDRLRAMEVHISFLDGALGHAQRAVFGHEQRAEQLAKEHGALADEQDNVSGELQRIDRGQRVMLTEDQTLRLDAEFAAIAGDDAEVLAAFPKNCAALNQRLKNGLEQARRKVAELTAHIEDRFAQFQRLWEDPNLGTKLSSYPDYQRIYDDIEATGLHKRRDEWRSKLAKWSGQDLVPLAHSMGDAIDEIEKRLDPINSILGNLPFGANANRLRIKMKKQVFDHVTTFRRELSRLSALATKELSNDELETRFKDLQYFMNQIRTKDDERGLPVARGRGGATPPGAVERDRDRLLDVRKHVTITAECYDVATDALISTHSSLGGKSGGESQELIAFIVGAALRFRLGDELRERPRFAPVFLDEGFIKSDAEFAGRAVRAWRGLGFQLVIGAPLDKVTGLEPHMNELLAITKNTRTHYSFLYPIKDRQAFRESLAALAPAHPDPDTQGNGVDPVAGN